MTDVSRTKTVTRIDSLTPEQVARFPEWIAKWVAIGLQTGETDWERFERGARAAYGFSGLAQPKLVIRVSSPLALALAAPIAKSLLRDQVRDQVGDQVHAQVRAQVGAQVRAQVGAQVRAQVCAQVGDQVHAQVRAQVHAQVRAQVGAQVGVQVGAQVDDQVDDQVRAQVGAQVHDRVDDQWRYYIGGQFWVGGWWSGSPAYVSYFREVCGLVLPGDMEARAAAYEDTVRSACWWLPTRDFIIVSARPVALTRDNQGRLHNDRGMAIRWPDGWGFYSWHGVRVPADVIERPETLTATQVLTERNQEVARAMRDRMGARFFDELGAAVLDEDIDGAGMARRLLSVAVPPALTVDEKIVAVHVTCPSTGHEYLLRVPPTMTRCADAVAWTNFQESETYSPLVEA